MLSEALYNAGAPMKEPNEKVVRKNITLLPYHYPMLQKLRAKRPGKTDSDLLREGLELLYKHTFEKDKKR